VVWWFVVVVVKATKGMRVIAQQQAMLQGFFLSVFSPTDGPKSVIIAPLNPPEEYYQDTGKM